MAGYLDASGLKHFKRKNDATYLGKQEKAASAKVADSVGWENVSGRPDLSALIPPGTLIHFAGKSVPDGYLIANGAGVSAATYPALYAAIGNTYGGNSTTFYLPNLSGRFLEGTTSTSSVGSYYSAGLPNITGSLTRVRSYDSSGAFYQGSGWGYNHNDNTTQGSIEFSASRSNSTYGYSSSVQPPAMAALVLIKF